MLMVVRKFILVLLLIWTYTIAVKACDYNSNPNYFSCTKRGNYPNYNDETCTTYYSCLKYSTGFYQNLKTCSSGTYFNRNTNKCDWYYKCPCTTEETTTTKAELLGVQANCVEDPTTTFSCSTETKSGCYADPRNPFCEKYIYCYVPASGAVYQQERTCAAGTFFNSSSDVCGCSVAFTCPCKRE